MLPRLTGRNNYREWSQSVELYLRINNLWATMLQPPNPIEDVDDPEENLFVATRKHIYIQCTASLNHEVKVLLFDIIEPDILLFEYRDMSVQSIWRDLKIKYGKARTKQPKLMKDVPLDPEQQ